MAGDLEMRRRIGLTRAQQWREEAEGQLSGPHAVEHRVQIRGVEAEAASHRIDGSLPVRRGGSTQRQRRPVQPQPRPAPGRRQPRRARQEGRVEGRHHDRRLQGDRHEGDVQSFRGHGGAGGEGRAGDGDAAVRRGDQLTGARFQIGQHDPLEQEPVRAGDGAGDLGQRHPQIAGEPGEAGPHSMEAQTLGLDLCAVLFRRSDLGPETPRLQRLAEGDEGMKVAEGAGGRQDDATAVAHQR